MRSLLFAVALLPCACAGPRPSRPPALTSTAARPSSHRPVAIGDGGVADAAAAAAPGLISDEECLARGGTIETEQTYEHERRRDPDAPVVPYRVCRIPSPRNGAVCRGDGDCGTGRCFCTGELSGPDVGSRRPDLRRRDGTAATGVCSDEHLPSGAWFCLVEEGRVVMSGIIID